MKLRSSSAAALIVAGAGCHLVAGLEAYEMAASTSASSVGSTGGGGGALGGGGAGADCATSCFARAPDGWAGPMFVFGDGVESCPIGTSDEHEYYPADEGDAYPQADCANCACTPPANACPTSVSVTFYENDGNCGVAGGGGNPAEVQVGAGCGGIGGGGYDSAEWTPAAGSVLCEASGGEATKTTPPRTDLCSFEDAPACGDGQLCAPRVSGLADVCVSHPSARACPDGQPYSDLRVVYENIEDTRGCEACGCSTATCTGVVETYSGNTCMTGKTAVFPGICTSLVSSSYATYVPTPPDCQPTITTPAPSGGDALVDPLVLCCLPPGDG